MKQINLAPPENQTKVRFMALRKLGLKVALASVCVITITAALSLLTMWHARNVREKTLAQINMMQVQENSSDYGKVRDQVKVINNLIGDAHGVFGRTPKLSRALEEMLKVLPQAVSLQSINLVVSKRQLTIAGFSPSREAVLELHRSLSLNKEAFEQVDYPLENLSRPKNVPFHFRIIFAPGVLSSN